MQLEEIEEWLRYKEINILDIKVFKGYITLVVDKHEDVTKIIRKLNEKFKMYYGGSDKLKQFTVIRFKQ
jgi:transcription antitermination factor NusG